MITLNATYQQTKIVVDPVVSTYQTVLITDSSVGPSDMARIYSCTVKNAKGRSSKIVLISGNGDLIPCICGLLDMLRTIVL